ncbi:adenylate/guanylate cyclase domain-containing protein [Tropicibacter sp. R16_0]|uniref:adenylate/guanylate cyclase domain-containing protein n=1 Tax=Tropicibacter sp. R16_0 TaxID=2821102 RepID=UPI001AD9897C|nr:adenylate/guanylate cyclase domain-containing protein [Tropicibacter sp. R16_0]MBO9449963.1 adenylate/guanylate cyclase domain-containing protein [Tropicibacter sp. R16_0]
MSQPNPDFATIPVNEADVIRELSVEKSVETVRNIPATVFSNLGICCLTFMASPTWVIASGAVYAYALIVFHNALLLRLYLYLRHKPRPRQVRQRTHRLSAFVSLLGGMAWAVFILLVLASSPTDVALLISIFTVATSIGALVISPSSPAISLAFGLPILTAFAFGAGAFGHFSPVLAAMVWITAMVGVPGFAVTNSRTAWDRARLHVQIAEERAERLAMMEQLSERLGKYISPQLYQSIFAGTQKVEVASQRKKLTVLFSDIVGFTTIAERLESEELTALLNQYLTEMSEIVLQHGGTLDKFIGDAVVVYFGDTDDGRTAQENAINCVQMALAMRARVSKLRMAWREQGLDDTIDLRIGINTGFCTVGNFGSDQRMDYTIIGSEVNLAARLEAAAEAGGILLAQETYALVKGAIQAAPAGTVMAKGFSRPV